MAPVTIIGTMDLPLADLTPFPGNARRGNVELIRESVKEYGQYRAIVVRREDDGRYVVLAGNHTAAALREEGKDTARCEVITCSDVQAKKINVADNRLSDISTNDDQDLVAILADIAASDDGLFGTGYTDDDITELLASIGVEEETEDETETDEDTDYDDFEPTPPAEPITKPGDVWILGDHRIICGDCRDPDTVATLLDGATINLAFTSPPYASQRDYDESSGFKPIPPDEYVEWFAPVAKNVRNHLADDGSWFVNIKASSDGLDTHLYVIDLVIAHARQWGWHFATEFCWERTGVPKNVTQRFKNQFEPVYQFALNRWKMRPDEVRHWSNSVPVPGGPGVGNTSWANAQGGNDAMFGSARVVKNRVRPGQASQDFQGQPDSGMDRMISEGMAYPGNRLPTFAGSHEATGHTAAFPVGLPAWFMKAYTDPGDVVYDPFMGSGSTLIAAFKEDRTAYGCEISPAYCDIICRRFQAATGVNPVLAATGEVRDFS